jgi:hypothetical protein
MCPVQTVTHVSGSLTWVAEDVRSCFPNLKNCAISTLFPGAILADADDERMFVRS